MMNMRFHNPYRWSDVPLTEMTLSNAVDEFLKAKELVFSHHTILDYSLTFRRLKAHIGNGKLMSTITPKEIREFLITVPGGKKNKLNARIALGSLWTFSLGEGWVNEHIIQRVEKPKPDKYVIRPYTKDEVAYMLGALARMGARDFAVILFLLDTGVRADELCGITVADIRGNYVYVFGKGAKERQIPVSAPTWKAVLEYLQEPRKPSRYIFLSEKGNKMSPNTLLQMTERVGARAGVEGCHPHRFRHTFAVNYLLNGGDPYTLQKILGHATLDMVKRYLAFVRDDLARVHEKASPVKNWGFGSRKVCAQDGQYSSHP